MISRSRPGLAVGRGLLRSFVRSLSWISLNRVKVNNGRLKRLTHVVGCSLDELDPGRQIRIFFRALNKIRIREDEPSCQTNQGEERADCPSLHGFRPGSARLSKGKEKHAAR